MRLVIADTSPINYLILIGHVDLFPRLFERVALPRAVARETLRPGCAGPGKRLDRRAAPWLEIHDATGLPQAPGLDEGEAAAIA